MFHDRDEVPRFPVVWMEQRSRSLKLRAQGFHLPYQVVLEDKEEDGPLEAVELGTFAGTTSTAVARAVADREEVDATWHAVAVGKKWIQFHRP